MRGGHTPTTSWRENRVRRCKRMSGLFLSRRDPPVSLIPAVRLSPASLRIPDAHFNRIFSHSHTFPR
jgi:hypothetical protein